MSEERQHRLYREAGEQFAPAIARLARSMEHDRDRARDLEQDIHCELFRSLARFEGACSLKTWVYRVAHNVAAEHRLAHSRRPATVTLDEVETLPMPSDAELDAAENHAVARARALIRQLPTLDAQVMVLWLEGESGAAIAEVTGLSSGTVSTRIHRLKTLIADALSDPLVSPQPEGTPNEQ